MFSKKGVVYEIRGREREQLGAMLFQLVAQQEAFFGTVRFIANREGIDLSKTIFDQERFAFVKAPEQVAAPQVVEKKAP